MLLARRGRLLRRRWPWVATAAVVVVGAGGGSAWALTRGSAAPATQQVLVTVGTGTLRTTVAATGTLEPAQQADLSFPVSGQVTAVPATVGAHVTAGQVLATVNSASLAAAVAQAQATVDADAARLSADTSAGTASSAQLAADQAALSAADNQLANAQQSLSEATLTSPIAGTVAAVNLTAGQQVAGSGGGGNGGAGAGGGGAAGSGAAGSGSGSGSASDIVVVSTTAYVVDASVDDTVVGQVKAGDQAQITPDGATAPVYGVVSSVGLLPASTSGVPTYPVTITVTGDPPGLYPGAGAAVTIIVRQLTNVLEVPTAAIHFTGGSPTVTVWRGGAGHAQVITVGAASGGETQVLSGLSAGQQVLVTRAVPAGGAGAATTGGGRRGFGRGGFGGAGFGGGGFGGGSFGGGGGALRGGGG